MSDTTDELLQTLEEKLNRTMDNISNEGLQNIKEHLHSPTPPTPEVMFYCYKVQTTIDVFMYYYTNFLVQSPGNVTLYYANNTIKANSSTDLVYTTPYTVNQVDANGNFNQIYLRSSEDDLYS